MNPADSLSLEDLEFMGYPLILVIGPVTQLRFVGAGLARELPFAAQLFAAKGRSYGKLQQGNLNSCDMGLITLIFDSGHGVYLSGPSGIDMTKQKQIRRATAVPAVQKAPPVRL